MKPENLIDALWPPGKEDGAMVYTVLDGARNAGIYPAAIKSGCEYQCLYRGELEPDLAEAAPYLVKLDKAHPFTYWLLGKGWGDSWGIFVQSTATLRDLRHHFRKFLMVYSPEAKPLYFRYYDPRVLRVYLPTCNAGELATVFGPVTSYVLEDADANTLLRLSSSDGALQVQKVALPPA
ncbi:MAG: DUF4123 domain-containing protein [Burkholderiales bacterium]